MIRFYKRRDMKKELTTRIIGGKFKGKKLKLPSKDVTRSSKSILKEALFNILQFDIVDKNFVEVFGGSGSVGLEALSRGAKRIYFIEKDRNSYEVLHQNAQSCDKNACVLYYGDAFEKLWDVIEDLRQWHEKAYFYFDPPFSIREGYEDIYKQVEQMIKKIPKEVVENIVVEHMSSYEFPEHLGRYERFKKRKFGKSTLSFYR